MRDARRRARRRCGSRTAASCRPISRCSAIGQARLREIAAQFPGVTVDDKGLVVVDAATGRTGNPKVFAGGDALGGELVVTAAQEGKRAARAICAHCWASRCAPTRR